MSRFARQADVPQAQAAAATYLRVELSSEGAAERVDGRPAVFVPRNAIVRVELRRGVTGERPVLQLLFGGTLVAAGLYLFSWVGGLADWGGHVPARPVACGLPMVALGAWVLWHGLRRAYYLHVQTQGDARKLVLGSRVSLVEVSALLEAARARFGYAVGWAIDEARPPW